MITVPKHERGVTRVFSLSLSQEAARKLAGDSSLQAQMLGVDQLRTSGVEVFRLADLGELGLPGYLREGVDAHAQDIERDRAKLVALDGWAMLVHSSAFEGRAVTLTPDAALTLIGTYAQQQAEHRDVDLESEAAKPYSGTPHPAPQPKPAGRGPAGSLAVILCLALVAFALWLVLA